MRRILVVAVFALTGAGVWSAVAAVAAPATTSVRSERPADAVAVVEEAPVCPAEQTEVTDLPAATDAPGGTSTVVSFTLIDPRCLS